MKCQICKKENEATNTFCTSCGNKILNENNYINPAKKQEIVLKIVNFILIIICSIPIFRIGYVLLSTFMLGLGSAMSGSSNVDITSYFKDGIITSLLFSFCSSIIYLVFNIIMGISMNKKNKNNIYIGKYKPVKKLTYVLLAWFLGIFGIHKFVIGDKKGGIIRLIIALGVPLFTTIISEVFSVSTTTIISFYVTSLCVMLSYSLSISDFVIGLSKVSDNNKMIYI